MVNILNGEWNAIICDINLYKYNNSRDDVSVQVAVYAPFVVVRWTRWRLWNMEMDLTLFIHQPIIDLLIYYRKRMYWICSLPTSSPHLIIVSFN